MRQDDSLYALPLLAFGVVLVCQLLLSDMSELEGPLPESNAVTEEVSLNFKVTETQESPMANDTVSVTEMQAHQKRSNTPFSQCTPP
jgi:hypothetical protein